MIGDKISDIKAGYASGCKTILVETGYGGKEEKEITTNPDFRALDLYDAVFKIISNH